MKQSTQRRASPVESDTTRSGGGAGGGAGKPTYDDLPAEAKQACDRFVEQGDTTRDAYVAEYFNQEEAQA